jgi:hypothetical protein
MDYTSVIAAAAVIGGISLVSAIAFLRKPAPALPLSNTHQHLWAGVDRKLQDAKFSFDEMARSLQPPERTPMDVVQQSTGAIVGFPWQQDAFYTHVDTFLAKARSVPEIICSCFGADHVLMQTRWWDSLTPDEKTRRRKFSRRFDRKCKAFRGHNLTNERNTSEHRLGFPSVEGKVIGPFGEVHTASPVKGIPIAESRCFGNPGNDPALQWAATQPPQPIQPRWDQFTIGGKPLFPECKAYLELARELRDQAYAISQQVHGNRTLTRPPRA